MSSPNTDNLAAAHKVSGVVPVRRCRQVTARFRLWYAEHRADVIACGIMLACVAGAVLAMLTMGSCASTVKVDPAKSEATRTVDGGSTKIRAIVYPVGGGPTR